MEVKAEINKLGFEWAGFQMATSHSSSNAQEGNRNLTLFKWKEVKSRNTEISDPRTAC